MLNSKFRLFNILLICMFYINTAGAQEPLQSNQTSGSEVQAENTLVQGSEKKVLVDESVFNEETYEYDPTGKRDPFLSFKGLDAEIEQKNADGKKSQVHVEGQDPLQRFELNTLSLIAVLWDTYNPKAMIKDPNANTYVVTLKTKIGRNNGYVAAIRESEVVIIEESDIEGRKTLVTRVIGMSK